MKLKLFGKEYEVVQNHYDWENQLPFPKEKGLFLEFFQKNSPKL